MCHSVLDPQQTGTQLCLKGRTEPEITVCKGETGACRGCSSLCVTTNSCIPVKVTSAQPSSAPGSAPPAAEDGSRWHAQLAGGGTAACPNSNQPRDGMAPGTGRHTAAGRLATPAEASAGSISTRAQEDSPPSAQAKGQLGCAVISGTFVHRREGKAGSRGSSLGCLQALPRGTLPVTPVATWELKFLERHSVQNVQGRTLRTHSTWGAMLEVPRAEQTQGLGARCLGLTWALCPERASGLRLHRQRGNTYKSRLSPCPPLFPSLSRTHSNTVLLCWTGNAALRTSWKLETPFCLNIRACGQRRDVSEPGPVCKTPHSRAGGAQEGA